MSLDEQVEAAYVRNQYQWLNFLFSVLNLPPPWVKVF